MATGDFPDPAGMVWSDAFGWHRYDPAPPWFREARAFAPPPNYHTIRPGVYVRFEVPNRLLGATILENGDVI